MDAPGQPYGLGSLGWLQFERLCVELLSLSAGATGAEWHALGVGSALLVPDGLQLGTMGSPLQGPTVVVAAWVGSPAPAEAATARVAAIAHEAVDEWSKVSIRT